MDIFAVPNRLYRSILLLWDLATLNVVLISLSSIVYNIDFDENYHYINFVFLFNLAWLASVFLSTLYLSDQWLSFEYSLKNTAQCFFITLLAVLGLIFFLKYDFSRLFVVSCFVLFGLMLLVNRLVFHFLVLKAKSVFNKRIVILGNNDVSRKLISFFNRQSQFVTVVGSFYDIEESQVREYVPAVEFNWQKVGSKPESNYYKSGILSTCNIDVDGVEEFPVINSEVKSLRRYGYFSNETKEVDQIPFLGGISDCFDFLKQNRIAEVYSTISPEQDPSMYDLAVKVEESLVHFKFVLDMNLFLKRTFHVNFIENLPVLSLRKTPLEDIGARIRKRMIDIGLSLCVIVFILSWLTPLMAILIKLESKGPVFFLQRRTGRLKKIFWCIKFRSLKVNNDSDIKAVTKDDDRITEIGRFIRRTNIDELPQFFNVLVGQMSIVGPRPHMLKHTDEFYTLYKESIIRHYVKPGITGLAQVSGFRGEITGIEVLKGRIEQDIFYIENWSPWLDIKIMLATIVATFKGDKGAF